MASVETTPVVEVGGKNVEVTGWGFESVPSGFARTSLVSIHG
jgi:hypothetical protein